MLVQRRSNGRLRLVEQHEHGLVSGELAAAWKVAEGGGPLAPSLVLATSLHDLGWRQLDRLPRWDPKSGLPHDFLTFPLAEKYGAATEGIDRVAELHPYSAVLVSLHYAELGKENAPEGFLQGEERRRHDLLAALENKVPPPEVVRSDLAHLQLFDHLSLFLCLASPGHAPGTLPEWLSAGRFRAVDSRGPFSARWSSPERVSLEPYPFEEDDFEVEVAHRDLEGAPFGSEPELQAAWSRAGVALRRVWVGPG